jgi:hypothetical protein
MEELISSVVKEEQASLPEVPWEFAYGTAGFRDRQVAVMRVVHVS